MKVSFIWLNGYFSYHNSCSKCLTFAPKHARKRPRHWSIALSMTIWCMSCQTCHAAREYFKEFLELHNPSPFPSLLSPPIPSLSLPHPFLPLEVGPVKSSYRAWGAL